MKTNKEVLKIARSHLGQGGARFRKYVGLPAGSAWCNAFVDYVANEGGVKSLYFNGKKETYCPHSIQWCKKNLAEIPLYLALPMDIIYFDWDKNGNPNHIGLVREKRSTSSIYTIEGNTNGGKVANKTRAAKYVQGIYRPHYVPAKVGKAKLKNDGNFGYYSIYNLQLALGMKPTGILTKETVKFLQKKVGASQDGAWGASTSRHVQAMLAKAGCYDGKIDGAFGKNSVIALQKWANKVNYPPTKKKPSEAKPTPKKTTPKATDPSAEAKKAVAWAKKIAKNGGYTYKKFDVHNKKTKQCPICHKLKGKYKGWNCIGFVSAAFYHGAGLKTVECACNGIGTDGWFNKVTLASWEKRNGKGWKMVTNGGKKGGADIPASKLVAGDALICYDAKGKFHHIALYTGNSKYIDCTNTSKNHIAERPYSRICKKYHVTRAFRYIGK